MQLEQLSIDDLELIQTSDYVIEKNGVDGLDEPERRVTATPNPGTDGGFIPSALYGMRAVSISGAVMGGEDARRALSAVCGLVRDPLLNPTPRTIRFTLSDGRSFQFLGHVSRYKAPNLGVGLKDFHIGIVAPDPLLYGDEQDSGQIAVPSGGGVLVPLMVPFLMASSTGGRVTLVNEGNETTSPVLRLVGPLTNPYVINSTTGQYMQLGYSVQAGDVVTIDMHENTILLNGGGGLLDAKIQGSKFWGLVTGPNDISFSTSNSADTGYLIISWRDATVNL